MDARNNNGIKNIYNEKRERKKKKFSFLKKITYFLILAASPAVKHCTTNPDNPLQATTSC